MLRPAAALCALGLIASAPGLAAQGFSYAGIGLRTGFDSLAGTFPRSQRSDGYIYVSADEARHHIYGIEISGSGETRRVRLSFERRGEAGPPQYPGCAAVQRDLAGRFGEPTEVREFNEEAMERSDRRWQGETEELILICFRGTGGHLYAEAVLMYPRAPRRDR